MTLFMLLFGCFLKMQLHKYHKNQSEVSCGDKKINDVIQFEIKQKQH